MHLSHLRAPALVHRPSSSSNNNNNSKEFQSINRSLSLVCRQIYPCTPPTTHHRGGAAGTGGLSAPLEERGGERHQGYKHACMRAYAYTDTDTFLFPVALGFVHLHVSVWCVSDLQASISRIHRTIELMYSDKSMMQVRRFFRSF